MYFIELNVFDELYRQTMEEGKKKSDLCLVLWKHCFKHVNERRGVVQKGFEFYTPIFNESKHLNNEDRQLNKKITKLLMTGCSLFTEGGKNDINFFFSVVGEKKLHIVLFKRDDNKLKAEDIKFFAIIGPENASALLT